MTEDIAAKIRAHLDEHEEHCLNPACTGEVFGALRALLDLHVDQWGFCQSCNERKCCGEPVAFPCRDVMTIVKSLGISVSPLRGPTEDNSNPTAGSQPRSGDPAPGVLSVEEDARWLAAERGER